MLTVNPPGGPEDSFVVGTVPAGKFVLVEPGISNDGGTDHTFFKVTGTLLNESDSGPNSNDTQFEFTGTQGTLTIDSGVFTPAATVCWLFAHRYGELPTSSRRGWPFGRRCLPSSSSAALWSRLYLI